MPNIQVGDQVIAFPDDMTPDDLNKAVKSAYEQMSGPKPSFLDKIGAVAQQAMAPQAMSPMSLAANVPSQLQQNVFNPVGQKVAETLAQGAPGLPQLPPSAAAGIGTAIQSAPDIGMAVQGMSEVPALAEAVRPGVEAIGRGLKSVGKRIMQGPATQEAIATRGQLASIPLEQQQRLAALSEQQKSLGANIENVRNAAGVPQDLNPPTMGEKNQAAMFFKNKIGSADPQALAKAYGKDGLAQLKDMADRLIEEGVNPRQAAYIKRGQTNVYAAMKAVGIPEVPAAYEAYGQGAKAIDQTPQEFLQKKLALQQQIRELQPRAALEQKLRGGVAGGIGLGGAGLYALKKLGLLGRH